MSKNFRLIIISFCLVIVLITGGCYSTESKQSAPTTQQNKTFDVTKYLGKWISTNYQIIQMDGYTANYGSELYLNNKNDEITEMNMYDISAPPANRIASIETEVKISPEGIGTFTFDNDGWGSHGSGTIEIYKNQIIINVNSQIEQEHNPDWRIYSGKREFIREKLSKNSLDIKDLDIKYNNVLINDNLSFREITDKIGFGMGYTENNYGLVSQNNGIRRFALNYSSGERIDLRLVFIDSKETILVFAELNTIPTARGIKVGDTVDKLYKIYGEAALSEPEEIVYQIGGKNLIFGVNAQSRTIERIIIDYNLKMADQLQGL